MDLNFDELRAQAKELDKGILFLREKCFEPSLFGCGSKAQETITVIRNDVLKILADCDEKLEAYMEYNLELEEVNDRAEELLNDILSKMGNLENKWKLKYKYQTFRESYCLPELNDSEVGQPADQETDEIEGFMSSTSNNLMMNDTIGRELSPLLFFSRAHPMTTPGRHQVRSSELVTPPHPEISDLTMQFLGRSAKVAKSLRY